MFRASVLHKNEFRCNALQIFHGGNSAFINSFHKKKEKKISNKHDNIENMKTSAAPVSHLNENDTILIFS